LTELGRGPSKRPSGSRWSAGKGAAAGVEVDKTGGLAILGSMVSTTAAMVDFIIRCVAYGTWFEVFVAIISRATSGATRRLAPISCWKSLAATECGRRVVMRAAIVVVVNVATDSFFAY